METLPYHTIPEPPAKVTAGTILARLVDGLAFRFRWATERLDETELDFRPGTDSMSLHELCTHIWKLVVTADRHFGGPEPEKPTPETLPDLRHKTLQRLTSLRERLAQMSADEIQAYQGKNYPFWNMIHGPLADVLSHIGQINGWRRMAGNPRPNARMFFGTPPTDE